MPDPRYHLRAATIAVLVENEAGILARVVGLFSGRGYNIESLTVAPVDEERRLSRITIVTTGTDMVIEQIKAQLDRLVPVHKVADLTLDGPAPRARADADQGGRHAASTGWRRCAWPTPSAPAWWTPPPRASSSR